MTNLKASLLCLYIVSPVLMSFFLLFFNINVPLSLIAFVAISFFIVFFGNFKGSKNSLYYLVIFLVFLGGVFLSVLYTPSSIYVYTKLFSMVNLVFCLVFLFYFKYKDFLKAIYWASIIVVIVGGIYFPVYNFYISGGGGSYQNSEVFKGFYLNFGLIAGLLFLCCFYLLDTTKTITSLLFLLFIFIVFSGARGPLLFVVLFILFSFILRFKERLFSNGFILFSFISSILIFIVIFTDANIPALERTIARVSLLFSDEKGGSVNTRFSYILETIDYIEEAIFFGHGFGSFGLLVVGEDSRFYPHNLVLEVWFELGLFGLLVTLSLLLFPVFLFIRTFGFKKLEYLIPYFYLFANSLKSNSLTDHRLLFLFSIIPILYTLAYNEKHDS